MTNYMGINRLKKIARHAVRVYTGSNINVKFNSDPWSGYRFYCGSEWLNFYFKDKNSDDIEGKLYITGNMHVSRADLTLTHSAEEDNTGKITTERKLRVITYYTSDFEPIEQPPETYLYDARYLVDNIKKNIVKEEKKKPADVKFSFDPHPHLTNENGEDIIIYDLIGEAATTKEYLLEVAKNVDKKYGDIIRAKIDDLAATYDTYQETKTVIIGHKTGLMRR